MNNNIVTNELDKVFFILEVKNFVPRRTAEGNYPKFSLSAKHSYSNYYIFRVNSDHIKRFELVANYLRLFDNFELRNKNERPTFTSINHGSSVAVRKKSDDFRKSEDIINISNNHLERNLRPSLLEGDVLNQTDSIIIDEVAKEDYLDKKHSGFILDKRDLNSSQDEYFGAKIKKEETRKEVNTFGNYFEDSGNYSSNSNEINFKSFIFLFETKYKFSFKENYLVYSALDDDGKKVQIDTKEFREFSVSLEDLSNYFKALIRLKFKEKRSNLEIVVHDKNDYNSFISRLEKLVPKGN